MKIGRYPARSTRFARRPPAAPSGSARATKIVVFGAVEAVGAEASPHIRLLVWDFVDVPPSVLEPAKKRVIQIFADVGVEIVWLNCGRPGAVAEACNGPVQPFSYALNLQPHVPSGLGISSVALGVSFDRNATVFLDRIRAESKWSRVPEYLVLACAAAHEVGHLLLPRGYHSPHGLMGARLKGEEWDSAVAGRLRFAAEEARKMRAQLRSR